MYQGTGIAIGCMTVAAVGATGAYTAGSTMELCTAEDGVTTHIFTVGEGDSEDENED